MGYRIQRARACGISERAMRGVMDDYWATLAYHDTVWRMRSIDLEFKNTVEKPAALEVAHMQGVQDFIDEGLPTVETCAGVQKRWPAFNAAFGAQAKQVRASAAALRAKDDQLAKKMLAASRP